MVQVFLRGGLGNQMFQYAAGLAVARQCGTSVVLDTTYVSDRTPRPQFAYRTYALDIFKLHERFTTLSRCARALPIPGLWLGLNIFLMKVRERAGGVTIIKERTEHDFDQSIFDTAQAAKGAVVLWGRWQTEKYFADIAREVRAAFQFNYPMRGEALAIANAMDEAGFTSVSVHVRRGDFVSMKNVEALHGKMDLSYYDRAAKYIAERVERPHFFIFSDDVAWCRGHLKLPYPMTLVPAEAAGPNDAFHLELMSRCKHNIVANSTFSWWGAWLNVNDKKIIVAPKQWYADPALERDVVPAGWVRL